MRGWRADGFVEEDLAGLVLEAAKCGDLIGWFDLRDLDIESVLWLGLVVLRIDLGFVRLDGAFSAAMLLMVW